MAPRRLRFRPNLSRVLVAIPLCAALLAVLWQGLLLSVSTLSVGPVAARFGTVESSGRVEAVFIRRESLVVAPVAGRFRPAEPAGERVARREVIGEIGRAGQPSYQCRAGGSGLIVYTADGLESDLTTSVAWADPGRAYSLARRSRPRQIGRGVVRRGEAVARLVDDREQYLLCRIPDWRGQAAVGQQVWAREHDALVPLAVAKIIADQGVTWVFLRAERFPPAWLDRRLLDLSVVWRRCAGTVVPVRYLQRREVGTGVLTMVNGRERFAPVDVLLQDRTQAVVRGLREGDILVR